MGIPRHLVSVAGRDRTFGRRLPAHLGGLKFFPSTEGGLKLLRRDLAKADQTLTRFAMRHVRPDQTVWDVGANVGLFTFIAAGLAGPAGRILAVEADAWLVGNLRRSARANPA